MKRLGLFQPSLPQSIGPQPLGYFTEHAIRERQRDRDKLAATHCWHTRHAAQDTAAADMYCCFCPAIGYQEVMRPFGPIAGHGPNFTARTTVAYPVRFHKSSTATTCTRPPKVKTSFRDPEQSVRTVLLMVELLAEMLVHGYWYVAIGYFILPAFLLAYGVPIRISEHRGRYVVLGILATWFGAMLKAVTGAFRGSLDKPRGTDTLITHW